VQAAVITEEAQGRDLLVSAQTGSGKTVAFGMAMSRDLLGDAERLSYAGKPLALVIAPTRELALQVSRELEWLYQPAGAASPPASAAWTPAVNAAPCRMAPISWSARRAVCATIWSVARSTCRTCNSPCWMKLTKCSTWASAKTLSRSWTARPRAPHLPVLGHHARADRRAGPPVSEQRAAHQHDRHARIAQRHHL
jgi:hypothetical protein